MRLTRKLALATLLAGMLVFGATMLAGCGCSRDKDGDDVNKTTIVGTWQLTQAMDQNNNSLALDSQDKKQTSIVIREDMSGSMSFSDGTYVGKFERTPSSDMTYSEAWGKYDAEAYTFTTLDGEIEIEFGYVVRKDGSQAPFIIMYIGTTSYYYDK